MAGLLGLLVGLPTLYNYTCVCIYIYILYIYVIYIYVIYIYIIFIYALYIFIYYIFYIYTHISASEISPTKKIHRARNARTLLHDDLRWYQWMWMVIPP